MESFRSTWDGVADFVHSRKPRSVSWYDSKLRRLRVTYYPDTGRAALFKAVGTSGNWDELCDLHFEGLRNPGDIAYMARVILRYQSTRFFPEHSRADAVGNPVGCRGARLRTVRR